ncbi:hypothetical protein [Streptomyces hydrogenans]|uniref:hypothetical protein n=1 Tax=Streptomyces hydrogenans TaxID=1873719 RepID=UPI003824815F
MHVLLASHLDHPLGQVACENFDTLVLGRVTTQTWTRLAPHIADVPDANSHPGRAHAVQGSGAHPVQVLYLTHTEAAAQAAKAS